MALFSSYMYLGNTMESLIYEIYNVYGVLNILTHNNCTPLRTNVHGDTMV